MVLEAIGAYAMTDERTALADELEHLELLKVIPGMGEFRLDKYKKEMILAALRALPPTLNSGADREALTRRIELARKFIAREYNDPAQELRGDWIDPRAKPAHDALCLCLQDLSALPRAVEGGASRPFYGAECPSYPDCNGGCGLGCTKEIEQTRAVEGGVVEGKVFEARNRGNTFGRFVQDTLRKAVDEEAALSHPNTGDGK